MCETHFGANYTFLRELDGISLSTKNQNKDGTSQLESVRLAPDLISLVSAAIEMRL